MKTTLEIAFFDSVQKFCVLAKQEDGLFKILAGYDTKKQAEAYIQAYTNPKSILERNP